MKITYNWLKQYIDFNSTVEELVHNLSMLGLEVDSFEPLAKPIQGLVVGEVLDKKRHPDADRLSVCRVNLGSEELAIVCGAPNVSSGQKVPVAIIGTTLPNGLKIKKSKIRGVESQGMICSEAELGLAEKSDGIMVLNDGYAPGQLLDHEFGETDYVIDVDVTPNRPDCFGMIGIARDVAASLDIPFRTPLYAVPEGEKPVSGFVKVEIHDARKCPRYTARYIENVQIKTSPLWLKKRLAALGVRSINNVVDITNLVMLETGQPLHAFDYDLVAGGVINVRTARQEEHFTTLDNKTHELNSEALLICDAEKPVALGGIMGGLNSEVSKSTSRILLESAYFDSVNIRRTAKTLGISTESSKRFERGTDPNGTDNALNRAAKLIVELAGGSVAKGIVDAYPEKISAVKITVRPRRVEQLLGVSITKERIATILNSLGFTVSESGENLEVAAPTFRPDVTREADVIEEVARIFGYDNIPANASAVIEQVAKENAEEVFTKQIRNALLALGFSEVVTFNLMSAAQAGKFVADSRPIRLVNPLSEELSTLRPSLLPSLLNSVRWNLNRGSKDLKLFEIGSTFGQTEKKPQEAIRLTGILTGAARNRDWKVQPQDVDFYDVKGVIERLLERNHIRNYSFSEATLDIGDELSLAIKSKPGKNIGQFGRMKNALLQAFDIEQDVYFFELDFNVLLSMAEAVRRFEPIPKFPPVRRDLAVVVEENVQVANLLSVVQKASDELLKNVELFDVFRSKQIGAGHKSVALNLTFFSLDRTLTEKEVDQRIERILSSLANEVSARLRS